jgi:hypothetical protein
MEYLSNNNLAYLSDDNVYKSTFGIVENNNIINKDDDTGNEKNFLTDEQIKILLENFENKSNNKNKNLLFFIFFIFFFLIFCFTIF